MSRSYANSRGLILVNPGGRVGPGIDFITRLGKVSHETLGDDYNIIGSGLQGLSLVLVNYPNIDSQQPTQVLDIPLLS